MTNSDKEELAIDLENAILALLIQKNVCVAGMMVATIQRLACELADVAELEPVNVGIGAVRTSR